jgi:ABC-2 type transport system permease protein
VLLSGLIFPLSSIAVGVRWISYLLPLTYFNEISRGVMLRAEPLAALWQPFLLLALLGAVVFTLASLRFRADLAPAGPRRRAGSPRGGERAPSAPGATSPTSATSAAGTPGTRSAG